jgi:hypothetical protein
MSKFFDEEQNNFYLASLKQKEQSPGNKSEISQLLFKNAYLIQK